MVQKHHSEWRGHQQERLCHQNLTCLKTFQPMSEIRNVQGDNRHKSSEKAPGNIKLYIYNVNPGLINHGLLILLITKGIPPNSHNLILRWYPPNSTTVWGLLIPGWLYIYIYCQNRISHIIPQLNNLYIYICENKIGLKSQIRKAFSRLPVTRIMIIRSPGRLLVWEMYWNFKKKKLPAVILGIRSFETVQTGGENLFPKIKKKTNGKSWNNRCHLSKARRVFRQGACAPSPPSFPSSSPWGSAGAGRGNARSHGMVLEKLMIPKSALRP